MNLNYIFFKDQNRKFNISKIDFRSKMPKMYQTTVLKPNEPNIMVSPGIYNLNGTNVDPMVLSNNNAMIINGNLVVNGTITNNDGIRGSTERGTGLIGLARSMGLFDGAVHGEAEKEELLERKKQKPIRFDKYASIFFKDETKKVKNLLSNIYVKKFFYMDLERMRNIVAAKEKEIKETVTRAMAGTIDTSMSTTGNVGIGYMAPFSNLTIS